MKPTPISALPPSCFYVPNFISLDEEQQILDGISRLPESKWTVLTHRRLLSLPSALTGAKSNTLVAAPMPTYLDPVVARLKQHEYFNETTHQEPNHVLINEYKPGQGIMPHVDGPSYSPLTATVSLASHTVLEIYRKNQHGERETLPHWRILQEPRSLLITAGEMYDTTLHGISEVNTDHDLSADSIVNWHLLGDTKTYQSGTAMRHTRISLTFRDVVKVAKLGNAMKFLSKR
ncbi:hypothetical protein B0A52_05230 [Exophiala mesophila]|uniref:Fe2OG dioxygenase domain-containing protein n=1 Tax=Exophiala mesophila TaxID=212818 RepID=A0A438N4M8_EXOME|nr:hypothetical protein B0A52_05230 [Exophiala mesophila]